jgi:hypothetical protein
MSIFLFALCKQHNLQKKSITPTTTTTQQNACSIRMMSTRDYLADPHLHVITFGPHEGTTLEDAPIPYVAQLAGYKMSEDGKEVTRSHEFDQLVYNIRLAHGSPCPCSSPHTHAPSCLLYSWGPNLGIIKGLLVDHIYSGLLTYPDATRLEPWIKNYVEHTEDVVAARRFLDNRHSRLFGYSAE